MLQAAADAALALAAQKERADEIALQLYLCRQEAATEAAAAAKAKTAAAAAAAVEEADLAAALAAAATKKGFKGFFKCLMQPIMCCVS